MMKKYILRGVIGLFALSLTLSLSANDKKGKQEYKREFEESFSIDADALIEINTQFASVNLDNWDKNEAKIVVEIIVEAKNEDSAEKIFKEIEIDIDGSRGNVEIESSIGNTGNCNNNEGYEINIDIYVPSSVSLEADVSFGDFDIQDITGKSEIKMGFGDLRADRLTHSDNEIFVEFGSGEIDELGAQEVGVSFGNLDIDLLTSSCELSNSYGELDVDEVSANISRLEIACSFGDTDVTFAGNAKVNVDATSSFGDVSFSSDFSVKTLDEGMFDTHESATLNGGGGIDVEVESSYGEVSLQAR